MFRRNLRCDGNSWQIFKYSIGKQNMSDSVVGISLPHGLFKDKVALVTGSSRGVGRATAVRLAEGGANVVVNYLSNDVEAHETVRMCKGCGVESIAVAADTAEFMAAQSLAKAAIEELNQLLDPKRELIATEEEATA